MASVCVQCGESGSSETLVYCGTCNKLAVHQYCLDEIPKDFDVAIQWFCGDHCASLHDRTLPFKKRKWAWDMGLEDHDDASAAEEDGREKEQTEALTAENAHTGVQSVTKQPLSENTLDQASQGQAVPIKRGSR